MLSNNSKSVWILAIFCIKFINCDILVGNDRDLTDKEIEDVRPLLLDSLKDLKGQADGTELNLIKITSAKSKVVSGKLYTVQAEFATIDNSINKNCKISLWHQPWSDFRETKFECDDATKYKVVKEAATRRKRDTSNIVGGDIDVDDETIDSLRKNISDSFGQLGASDASKQLTLKNIFGAKKKIVAGILYTIRGTIETVNGTENCIIQVWEKPWINFRKVNVDCESGNSFEVIHDNRPKRSSIEQQQENVDDFDFDLDGIDSVTLFEQYKKQFNRSYIDQNEEEMRYRIFKNNLYLIKQLRKFELGTAQYGLTEFADMTQDEYQMRTGLRPDLKSMSNNDISNPYADIPNNDDLPEAFDWRAHGVVTPVKNQGNCGSCWAFSVTGNVEGLYAVQYGQLLSLSEQELVDCDDSDSGCNGGLPDNAVKYLEKRGGLETENDYPYIGHRGKCHFNESLARVRVSGVIDFKEKDEIGMAKWLVKNGPISIGINANAMQFYRGGISHPWKALCSASGIDHGVLIVGFGVSHYPVLNKTLPFWTIKNSWGTRWGEQGYYRIYRGDNSCGVSSMASSAVLSKNFV